MLNKHKDKHPQLLQESDYQCHHRIKNNRIKTLKRLAYGQGHAAFKATIISSPQVQVLICRMGRFRFVTNQKDIISFRKHSFLISWLKKTEYKPTQDKLTHLNLDTRWMCLTFFVSNFSWKDVDIHIAKGLHIHGN